MKGEESRNRENVVLPDVYCTKLCWTLQLYWEQLQR